MAHITDTANYSNSKTSVKTNLTLSSSPVDDQKLNINQTTNISSAEPTIKAELVNSTKKLKILLNSPTLTINTKGSRHSPHLKFQKMATHRSSLGFYGRRPQIPRLAVALPSKRSTVSSKMPSNNLSQPLVITRLQASDFNNSFVSSHVSTFPSMSSSSSTSLPSLGRSLRSGRVIQKYSRTITTPSFKPYTPRNRYKPNTRYTNMAYKYVTNSRPTKLGFYSPIKISSIIRNYPKRVYRYYPGGRTGVYSYNGQYSIINPNYHKNNSKKSRSRRSKMPKPPRQKKRSIRSRRNRRQRIRKENSSDNHGDDDYTLPQRQVRRIESVEIDMPTNLNADDNKNSSKIDYLKNLSILEKNYFSSFENNQLVDENEENNHKNIEKQKLINNLDENPPNIPPNSNEKIVKKEEKIIKKIENNSKITKISEKDNKITKIMPCDICGLFNSPIADLIVYCDGCGVAVHKLCYGIRRIPEDKWFCMPCSENKDINRDLKKSLLHKIPRGNIKDNVELKDKCPRDDDLSNNEEPKLPKINSQNTIKTEVISTNQSKFLPKQFHSFSCPFCPIKSNYPRAYKRTNENNWSHLACAIYYPEMIFSCRLKFQGFSPSSLDSRRSLLRCHICQTTKGYCLQCNAKSCTRSFHPLCARISKTPLYFTIGEDDYLETRLWCVDHIKNRLKDLPKNRTERRISWKPAVVSTRQNANSDWHFTEKCRFYPLNEKYETEERNILFDQKSEKENDLNEWVIISTTDLRSEAAFAAHKLIASQWDETIVGGLEPVIERRISRKAVGYSSLSNPSNEIISAANWNFWEVNSEIVCLCIKFMVCKRFTTRHISTRRKRCGSLLAAHLVDLALSRRRVQWVLVCSESGYPEKFWKSLGFESIPRRERARFSVVSEAELNPFRDTVLMRLTRESVLKSSGYSLTAKAFKSWRLRHLKKKLRVIFLFEGVKVREEWLPLY